MSKTVLILEDSRTQAIIIAKMFERAGWTPVFSFEPDAAQAHLRLHRVDLLILDVFVESSNTLEHIEEYRELAPGVPIAIMTAGRFADPNAAPDALNKARRARVDFLLPKPFHFEDIKQICEDLETPRSRLRIGTVVTRVA